MRRTASWLTLGALAFVAASCGDDKPTVPIQGYRVVQSFPHDPTAYCQGLIYEDGKLYESTGLVSQSTVRRVALETGEVEKKVGLPGRLFGEGLTMFDGELYQLTWHAGQVNILDPETLEVDRTLRYGSEGWGLTTDGKEMIMSDGSSFLTFRDPKTFKRLRRLEVTILGSPVDQLNELEWVDGEIWANRWKYNYIVRINPETGEIVGSIDLKGIFDASGIRNDDAVLNGIAYDATTKRIFVTGKLWPKIFEIEVTD